MSLLNKMLSVESFPLPFNQILVFVPFKYASEFLFSTKSKCWPFSKCKFMSPAYCFLHLSWEISDLQIWVELQASIAL